MFALKGKRTWEGLGRFREGFAQERLKEFKESLGKSRGRPKERQGNICERQRGLGKALESVGKAWGWPMESLGELWEDVGKASVRPGEAQEGFKEG